MHEGTYKDKEKHVKTNRLIASNCHGHIDRQLYEYEMFIYSRLFFLSKFQTKFRYIYSENNVPITALKMQENASQSTSGPPTFSTGSSAQNFWGPPGPCLKN